MKYQLFTRVLDGGQAITRVIIDCEHEIDAQALNPKLFSVKATRTFKGQILDQKERMITSVFTTTKKVDTPTASGRYIHLVLLTGSDTKGASTLTYCPEDQKTHKVDLDYQITLKENLTFLDGTTIEAPLTLTFDGFVNHHVDIFEKCKSESGLVYRQYCPTFDGNKKPLIIWLHGMGEGGTDNELPLIANRGGVAFVRKDTQAIFGGAYVILPQCPTFWLPIEYQGEIYDEDYTPAILSLIEEVCLHHPDIDENRIYIGGCSMGGYQTIKTVLAAPRRFAAAFPVCPGYEINMKEAWKLKEVPMWFIHCMTDTTVPSSYSVKNYEHMIRAGAQAELTLYPDIRSHGQSYFAHAAWIPTLNNDPISRDGTHLFEWLANHSRKKERVDTSNASWIIPTLATTSIMAATLYHYYRKSKKNKK